MIKIENVEVMGWEAAIRGMRNPMNSWKKSDSYPAVNCTKCGKIEREGICKKKDRDCTGFEFYALGHNDLNLMTNLRNAGTDHRKFMRMITVYMDILAPLYWWKEFDTYKVGTVANSCSTMHKIAEKEFTLEDFSREHLSYPSEHRLGFTVDWLNEYRDIYNNWDSIDDYTKNTFRVCEKKDAWWLFSRLMPMSMKMIQERRMIFYDVIRQILFQRSNT